MDEQYEQTLKTLREQINEQLKARERLRFLLAKKQQERQALLELLALLEKENPK